MTTDTDRTAEAVALLPDAPLAPESGNATDASSAKDAGTEAGAGVATGAEVAIDAEADPDSDAPGDTNTDSETAAPLVPVDMDRALEAVLMVADEPQSLVNLATAVGRPVAAVREAIARLVADFDGESGGVRRGFELREVGSGWRIYVRGEYDDVVRDYVLTQNPSRLSQAALETLAVIAYKQPISRGQVAAIRAVNVDSVVRTLLGRGLISEVYTDSETGAIHYGTTDLLLTQLGINSIEELPHISPLLADGAEGFDDIR